jgi:hypothetical protein
MTAVLSTLGTCINAKWTRKKNSCNEQSLASSTKVKVEFSNVDESVCERYDISCFVAKRADLKLETRQEQLVFCALGYFAPRCNKNISILSNLC